MRWLIFAVLTAIVIVAQTSLAWRFELGPVRPEWTVVLAVFYVMHAASADALIAAWLIGLILDLCSDARLGLFALTFGLTALVVLQFRHLFFRDHLLTHLVLTWCFAFLVYLGVGLYRLVFFPENTSVFGAVLGIPMLTGLYAAAWTMPAYYLFKRMRTWMGLKPVRSRR